MGKKKGSYCLGSRSQGAGVRAGNGFRVKGLGFRAMVLR